MSAAIGTWEVALDLVELGRLDEAKTLLDAELPDRDTTLFLVAMKWLERKAAGR